MIAPLDPGLLPAGVVPAGVRARIVERVNGLAMHVLEAGEADRPLILLLHGFPELGFSWRHVMAPLAAAGFHVVAPDQRGYGRTLGWEPSVAGDLAEVSLLNLARDMRHLIAALGHRRVACLVGHDFGSPVASTLALARPDLVDRLVLMSAPFAGPPTLDAPPADRAAAALDTELAALPRPRKHYQHYYCGPEADAEMRADLRRFLRNYYHMKSADWAGNRPAPLAGNGADNYAQMPTYYVMDRDRGMAETVEAAAPSDAVAAACAWLTDAALDVYAEAFARRGFQGGLDWYRCRLHPRLARELDLFAGRTLDMPSMFVAGLSDWGTHQVPGAFERMQGRACTRMTRCCLIGGAGHWVQQEQPEQVSATLLRFLDETWC